MFIKVPTNLLQNNPFRSPRDLVFYCFCASFPEATEKYKGKDIPQGYTEIHYSNMDLVRIFGWGEFEYSKMFGYFVQEGLAKFENKHYYNLGNWGVARKVKLSTEIYKRGFEESQGEFITVETSWIKNLGLPMTATLVLAGLKTKWLLDTQKVSRMQVMEVNVRVSWLKELLGIKDVHTVYRALDLLKTLELIKEYDCAIRYYKTFVISDHVVNDYHDKDGSNKKETLRTLVKTYKARLEGKTKQAIQAFESYIRHAVTVLESVLDPVYKGLFGETPREMWIRRLEVGT